MKTLTENEIDMSKYKFKLTDTQYDKIFGDPYAWYFDHNPVTERLYRIYERWNDDGVVNDMTILHKLRRMGFIRFHEKTGTRVLRPFGWHKANFVLGVDAPGWFCFKHRDEVIAVSVRDMGCCDCPFVVMGRGRTEEEALENLPGEQVNVSFYIDRQDSANARTIHETPALV